MTLDEQVRNLEDRMLKSEVSRDEQSKIFLPVWNKTLIDVGTLQHSITMIESQVTTLLPTKIALTEERLKSLEAKMWWAVTLLLANMAAIAFNAINLYVK